MNFLETTPPHLPSFIIGTRGSALAQVQTKLVCKLLEAASPDFKCEQKIITTLGDARPGLPLDQPVAEGSGLFTRQLEESLQRHEIDAAVHSLKDLPVMTTPGLRLAAILPRAATQDLLITVESGGLDQLAPGSVVGTSSPRRMELLRQRRPDLRFVSLRGNVPTRLKKLAMNQREHRLDAIVLARAGMDRLGYTLALEKEKGALILDETTLHCEVLEWMLPAPGQGAIAIETRVQNYSVAIEAALASLHDETTGRCVTTERLLLQYLGGGCHMALGALATVDQSTQQLHLRAVYTPSVGGTPRYGEATGATPEEVALLVSLQLGNQYASEAAL